MVTLTDARQSVEPIKKSAAAKASYRHDDRSDYSQRQLIGYIGLVLPLILIILVLDRDGPAKWRNLDSISAYYYTGAVTAFVGMLVALAVYLFSYKGFANEHQWADRGAGMTAAVAALGVALFPAAAPKDVTALTWWSPWMRVVHYSSAVLLFTMFAAFALWLFRITPTGTQMKSDKQRRNRVYLICGIVIVASMLWAGIAGSRGSSIFVPESVALIAFAVSWLVKGRALTTIADTARSLMGK